MHICVGATVLPLVSHKKASKLRAKHTCCINTLLCVWGRTAAASWHLMMHQVRSSGVNCRDAPLCGWCVLVHFSKYGTNSAQPFSLISVKNHSRRVSSHQMIFAAPKFLSFYLFCLKGISQFRTSATDSVSAVAFLHFICFAVVCVKPKYSTSSDSIKRFRFAFPEHTAKNSSHGFPLILYSLILLLIFTLLSAWMRLQ